MSVKRRLKNLAGGIKVKGPAKEAVIIEYPDGRLLDTATGLYTTQDEVKSRNLDFIVWLPDNGREKQP